MRQRSANKRKKKPQILSPDEFQKLHDELHEPYRTRVIVAMCTGMRVSEVLALRWDHINFKAGVMLVQQGVVNGRIGFVKTGASNDYIPLDPAFAPFPHHWWLLLRGRDPAASVEACWREDWPSRYRLAHLQAYVQVTIGRNRAPIGVQQKLMRHSNVATTMNIYGNASLRAKREANSNVVQMVMAQQNPPRAVQQPVAI